MQSLVVLAVVLGVAYAGPMPMRLRRGANGDQQPKVWDALAALRGKDLTVDQIQELYPNVQAGVDFPILAAIPDGRNIDCASFKQPGFYADVSDKGRCQVFDRCDINGNLTSYLCPNMTLFNQITLICDWWYNVDCSREKALYDYSNSRLYQDGLVLLDNQDEIKDKTGAVAVSASAAPSSSSSSSSSSKKASGGGKKAAGGGKKKSAATTAASTAAPADAGASTAAAAGADAGADAGGAVEASGSASA